MRIKFAAAAAGGGLMGIPRVFFSPDWKCIWQNLEFVFSQEFYSLTNVYSL